MSGAVIDDVVLRPARVDDAEALSVHARRLAEDPQGGSIAAPDEVRTAEEMRALLTEICADPRILALVADRAGTLVGEVSLRSFSRHRSTAHVRLLGIGIARQERGRGLGTRMVRSAIDWARAHAVRRIELNVLADNAAAIALYKKMGFEREGVRRSLIVRDGIERDDWTMALLL